MRSVINITDLSMDEILELTEVAADIENNPLKYSQACKGKKLATLFYEPSTRTRLSFEAAMYELGGDVIGFSDASNSSTVKGEGIFDTAKVISCYADIIAMRHFIEGAPTCAALNASIPVINAGDGSHSHPTQTLADIYTVKKQLGRLSDITIGCCGDLKYGRTVHSLVEAFSKFKNIKFIFISPSELSIPKRMKKELLEKYNVDFVETESLENYIHELDVLYMTRIQKERFSDIEEYDRLKDQYILSSDKLRTAKESLCIMHPLPRVNEITLDVDDDPRACYFKQVKNGKIMRMALILKLLNDNNSNDNKDYFELDNKHCSHSLCVTYSDKRVKSLFKISSNDPAKTVCYYCEHSIEN